MDPESMKKAGAPVCRDQNLGFGVQAGLSTRFMPLFWAWDAALGCQAGALKITGPA